MKTSNIKYAFLLILMFTSYAIIAQTYVSTRDQFPRPDYPFFYRDINLLSKSFPPEKLKEIILSAEEWHPYPDINEREAWSKIPTEVAELYLSQAWNYLGYNWPSLKATDFMAYYTTGHRYYWGEESHGRRNILYYLAIAECLEGGGRFLDDIINGIWPICEETFWGVPPHLFLQEEGHTLLPKVEEPVVDLFAAEKAAALAWTYYLLGAKLDSITPLLGERIYYEVNRRIFEPMHERSDWRWEGLRPNMDRRVNNWDPWICSNWLSTILILEKDKDQRADHLFRLFRILDQFLNTQPEDGACEEGPNYWTRAGGSLFDCLEQLKSASEGVIDLFDQPMIQHTGSFIYSLNIGNNYVFNYSDASPKLSELSPALVFKYGKALDDPVMQQYGGYLHAHNSLASNYLHQNLLRGLRELFTIDELSELDGREALPRDSWYPSIQLMSARSEEGSSRGLFLALKGNYNRESHNHNDAGNFIIYVDGHPAIIDIGSFEYTYTGGTLKFSDINKQSGYHNLPVINHIMQGFGMQYRVTDASYSNSDQSAYISLNLAKTYPEQAGVKLWERTFNFIRNRQIELQESYRLDSAAVDVSMVLMIAERPDISEKGLIIVPSLSRDLYIHYESSKLNVRVEEISLDDPNFIRNWGGTVYRILLSFKELNQTDSAKLVFKLNK